MKNKIKVPGVILFIVCVLVLCCYADTIHLDVERIFSAKYRDLQKAIPVASRNLPYGKLHKSMDTGKFSSILFEYN